MNDTLNIQVERIFRLNNSKSVKAYVDLSVNNALLIKGIRVFEGKNGFFMIMPQQRMRENNRYYETVRFLNDEVRQQIIEKVLTVYAES